MDSWILNCGWKVRFLHVTKLLLLMYQLECLGLKELVFGCILNIKRGVEFVKNVRNLSVQRVAIPQI